MVELVGCDRSGIGFNRLLSARCGAIIVWISSPVKKVVWCRGVFLEPDQVPRRSAFAQRYHPRIRYGHARMLSRQPLDDAGGAHAAADAHCDEAELHVAAPHLVDDLHRKLGPCGSQGMPQGDGPAVDVGFLRPAPTRG